MQFETYTIPSHWASYLINGDASGYEEVDLIAADAFVDSILEMHTMAHCVAVGDEGNFMRWHDAAHVMPLAADCATFTFQVA